MASAGIIRLLFLFVITLILLVFFVQRSSAIKCWRCQSLSDPPCADPFDNSSYYMTDCDFITLEHMPHVKSTMCRKTRQKIEGQWRITRSCAFLGEVGEGTGNENHCLMRTGTYDIFVEHCTCDSKDGCNGAMPHSAPFGLIGLFAICSWWYQSCQHSEA